MALPAWVGQKERLALRPIRMEIADSMWSAPGWRLWGKAHWTCVPPVDMPIDRTVLEAIRTVDPGAIPIWRKQRYLPPNGTEPVLFTHYAIARHVRDPKGERRLFHVEMPAGAKHPVPNLLEYVLQVRGERMMHHGGPGDFLPFGMGLYHALREMDASSKSVKDVDEELRRQDEEHEAAKRKIRADLAERNERLNRRLAPVLEHVTEADYRAHWARVNGLLRERKPFVHVGRTAS